MGLEHKSEIAQHPRIRGTEAGLQVDQVDRGPSGCLGMPRGASGFLRGVPQGPSGFLGVPRGASGSLGVPRGASGFLGVPRGALG